MNLVDTNDPASIGALIIIGLIITGALAASRLLHPLEKLLAQKTPAKPKSKTTMSHPIGSPRQMNFTPPKSPAAPTAPTGEAQPFEATPIARRATQPLNTGHQWNRIADRLGENIERVRQASENHSQAATQLRAAEFSLSELFREFPGARDTLNPVTYVAFPTLRTRPADDRDDEQTDKIDKAAQAASA